MKKLSFLPFVMLVFTYLMSCSAVYHTTYHSPDDHAKCRRVSTPDYYLEKTKL